MTLTMVLSAVVAAALVVAAIAATLYVGARSEVVRLLEVEATARARADLADAARVAAERELALARREVEHAQSQLRDFDKTKADAIQAAQAAALASSREMSSKLLEDHKREAEAQRKEGEERVRQATEGLTRRFEDVSKAVASLNEQVTQNKDAVETVWRALSSPGGAGHFAEIGLENTLKSFGLEAGRDFAMQYNIAGEEGGRLRPDAVVFLPGDTLLVVDSKASKFLLDQAAAKDEAGEAAAGEALAASMGQHLKALAAKDYRGAIEADYRKTGYDRELRRVLSVMYLPNEGALEKLQRADPDFVRRAAAAQIVPVGPAGLASIIGFARMEIDLGRQAANRERIVEASRSLLEAITVSFNHIRAVGNNIKQAAGAFEKLTGSLNKRLLPRARALAELGVRPASGKELPPSLPPFQVVTLDDAPLLEGEASEAAAPVLAPPEGRADG